MILDNNNQEPTKIGKIIFYITITAMVYAAFMVVAIKHYSFFQGSLFFTIIWLIFSGFVWWISRFPDDEDFFSDFISWR